MRDHEDYLNNGQSRYQELISKYEKVKHNEKKLSDVLDMIIKELEVMKKEKEDAVEALKSFKNTSTAQSKPPNRLGSEGPST